MSRAMDVAMVYAEMQVVLPIDLLLNARKEQVDKQLQAHAEDTVIQELLRKAADMGGWPGIPTISWLVPEDDYLTIEGPRAVVHACAPVLRMRPTWRYIKTVKHDGEYVDVPEKSEREPGDILYAVRKLKEDGFSNHAIGIACKLTERELEVMLSDDRKEERLS